MLMVVTSLTALYATIPVQLSYPRFQNMGICSCVMGLIIHQQNVGGVCVLRTLQELDQAPLSLPKSNTHNAVVPVALHRRHMDRVP